MEKNIKKCVCIAEPLAVRQKLTQHCESTLLQLKNFLLNQKEIKQVKCLPFQSFPPSWEVEKETHMNFFWHKSFLIVFKISIT